MNKNICDCTVIHHDIVDEVKEQLPDNNRISELATFFKVLGDNTRLKIISVLLNKEMCVCDISYLLNLSQSLISHQLQVLRKARFVKFRRDGKVVYYSLDDSHIKEIYESGLIHICESGE